MEANYPLYHKEPARSKHSKIPLVLVVKVLYGIRDRKPIICMTIQWMKIFQHCATSRPMRAQQCRSWTNEKAGYLSGKGQEIMGLRLSGLRICTIFLCLRKGEKMKRLIWSVLCRDFTHSVLPMPRKLHPALFLTLWYWEKSIIANIAICQFLSNKPSQHSEHQLHSLLAFSFVRIGKIFWFFQTIQRCILYHN